MYTATNYGSVSGIVHLIARRPVLAATVALVAVSMAYAPRPVPPPPSPIPPAVITMTAKETAPEPTPTAAVYATCQFGPKAVVTNLCKASLDSVALYLQTNPNSSIVVQGDLNNAISIRHYLTNGESKFGIAASRVSIDADYTFGDQVSIRER
jgi:hypothetical protein